jgi:hypothetical protein
MVAVLNRAHDMIETDKGMSVRLEVNDGSSEFLDSNDAKDVRLYGDDENSISSRPGCVDINAKSATAFNNGRGLWGSYQGKPLHWQKERPNEWWQYQGSDMA